MQPCRLPSKGGTSFSSRPGIGFKKDRKRRQPLRDAACPFNTARFRKTFRQVFGTLPSESMDRGFQSLRGRSAAVAARRGIRCQPVGEKLSFVFRRRHPRRFCLSRPPLPTSLPPTKHRPTDLLQQSRGGRLAAWGVMGTQPIGAPRAVKTSSQSNMSAMISPMCRSVPITLRPLSPGP